jgi:hypothetical protein
VIKADVQTLAKQLNALAEVFDKKPVTPGALEVWFDTLRDFPCEQVMGLLIGWPKSHAKMPVPVEVFKVMNEWAIDQREKKAERENKAPEFYPGVGGKQAEAFLAQMRATLNKPAWSPTEHWKRVHERSKPGSIARRYAEEILMKKGLREPGSDDEQGF